MSTFDQEDQAREEAEEARERLIAELQAKGDAAAQRLQKELGLPDGYEVRYELTDL